jgi:hypothetical protein
MELKIDSFSPIAVDIDLIKQQLDELKPIQQVPML